MIKKHQIIWFYVFTLIFTILLGGMGQALCAKFTSKEYQAVISMVLVEMGPALGALLMSICTKDRDIWRNMKWNPFKNIKSLLFVFLSFIISAGIVACATVVMSASGKAYTSSNYNKILIPVILLSLIGCIGEETGWRGFMLPSFNKKYSLLMSGIFTGILWGAWHFGKIASFGFLAYVLFIVLITEFSVIMTWIYKKSDRNMTCMVFFHLGINTASILLLTGREGVLFYTVACVISAIICLLLVLTDKKTWYSRD